MKKEQQTCRITTKKLLAVFISVVMLLSLLPVTSFAEGTVLYSGQCGDNAYWKITDDGTLTIYGSGPMQNFNATDRPGYEEHIDSFSKLIIENGVTSIGDYAFYKYISYSSTDNIIYSNLTGSLAIPDSVISIGNYAFAYCSNFNGALTLGNSLGTIGNYAFCRCSSFTGSLAIPDSVVSIGDSCFIYCSSFNGSLTIGTSVDLIGNGAFFGCTGFTGDLIIPDSVHTIRWGAFSDCIGLNGELRLSRSLTEIEGEVFRNCHNLIGNLVIGNSVTVIGQSAFENCSGLTGDLVIPDSVTQINAFAFRDCTGFDGSLTISSNIETFGYCVFENCCNFTGTLVMPNSPYNYSNCVFHGCASNTDIEKFFKDHPWYITIMEETGREYPTPTTSGYISYKVRCNDCRGIFDAVKRFDYSAIESIVTDCDEINLFLDESQEIYFELMPENAYSTSVSFSSQNEAVASVSEYGVVTAVSVGSTFVTITVSDGFSSAETSIPVTVSNYPPIESISPKSSHYNLNLNSTRKIVFDVLPEYAYYTQVSYSSLDEDVATVSEDGIITGISAGNTFVTITISNDYSSATTSVPVTVKDATVLYSGQCGYDAWWEIGTDGVLTIYPGSSGSSSMWAFASRRPTYEPYLDYFSSLVIEDGITSIGSQAFYKMRSVSVTGATLSAELIYRNLTGDLVIPDSVTSIGEYAFCGCSGFNGTLTLGNSIEYIYSDAFYNCGFTGSLTIPDTVKLIFNAAFYGCRNFTGSLVIPDSVQEIKQWAFGHATGFTGTLTIGNSVESIGDYAFYSDNFTGDLVIPDSVVYVGASAFSECRDFDGTLYIGSSVETIGEKAFMYCMDLSGKLLLPDSVTDIGACAFHGCAANTDIGKFYEDYPDFITILEETYSDNSEPASGLIIYCDVMCNDCGNTFYAVKTADYSAIESIRLWNDSITMYLNDTRKIGFNLLPDNAYYSTASFESLDENIAVVSEDGTVTGVSVGETTVNVTVSDGSSTATAAIPVTVKGDTVLYRGQCGPDAWWEIAEDGILTIYTGTSGKSNMWNFGSSRPTYEEHLDSFSSVVIEGGITSIGTYAFSRGRVMNSSGTVLYEQLDYTNLTGSLVIPDTVTSIGNLAFARCSNLDGTLTLGDSVKTISKWAFFGCSSLTGSLIIPDSVQTIEEGAFAYCRGLDGTLTLGDSLETIGDYAFEECNGFTGGLTIPDSVTSIGYSAFVWCGGFNGPLMIGSSVESIGNMAFMGCSSLTGKLYIPESVDSVGYCAFHGCAADNDIEYFFEDYPDYIDHMEDECANYYSNYIFCADCSSTVKELEGYKLVTDVSVGRLINTGLLVYDPDIYEGAWFFADEDGDPILFENDPLEPGKTYSVNYTDDGWSYYYRNVSTPDEMLADTGFDFDNYFENNSYGYAESYIGYYNGNLIMVGLDWGNPDEREEYPVSVSELYVPGTTDINALSLCGVFDEENDFGLTLTDQPDVPATFEENPIAAGEFYTGVYEYEEDGRTYTMPIYGYANESALLNVYGNWTAREDLPDSIAPEEPHLSLFNEDGYSFADVVYTDGKLVLLTYYAHYDVEDYNVRITLKKETGTGITLTAGQDIPLCVNLFPFECDYSELSATTENSGIAAVSQQDGAFTLTGTGAGDTTLYVTLTNGNGSSFVKAFSVTVLPLPVSDLEITNPAGDTLLPLGAEGTIEADVTPFNATNKTLSFTSDNTSVIQTDADGNFRAVGTGTAVITVGSTDGSGILRTVSVSVYDAAFPNGMAVLAGGTGTVAVEIINGSGYVPSVTYSSMDEAVATVTSDGVVTGVAPGTAVIKAEYDGVEKEFTVTVARIEVTVENTDLDKGCSTTVYTAVYPDDAGRILSVTYTSSDPSVLTVKANGEAVAVGAGEATITVCVKLDINGEEVTLTDSLDSVSFDIRSGTLEIEFPDSADTGSSGTVDVDVDTNRSYYVEFFSSDDYVVSIDRETGEYKALRPGEAVITARIHFSDGSTKDVTKTITSVDPDKENFRCSLCDTYDSMKDTPVIGVLIKLLHFFVHFLQSMYI